MPLWHYISDVFFNRVKPHEPTFEERIAILKQCGFEIHKIERGALRITRRGIGAVIHDVPGQRPHIDKAGLIVGDEIGLMVNGGYQMFFVTPSGKRRPALASQLQELHGFEEDLRDALGLTSLYNLGLGTTADLHLYDRLAGRDRTS